MPPTHPSNSRSRRMAQGAAILAGIAVDVVAHNAARFMASAAVLGICALAWLAAPETKTAVATCPAEAPDFFVADGTDRNGAPLPSVIPPQYVQRQCPKGPRIRMLKLGEGMACLLAFGAPPCETGFYDDRTRECVILLTKGEKVPNSIGRTK